nr:bacteriocin immunity protein [Photorhabdus sp. RW14-46]
MTWGVSWLAHWIKYQNTASGGDLIFYPEEGIEDNPEGVLKVIYPMDFKLPLCWLHSLTPVTSLSMLPGDSIPCRRDPS